MDGMVLACVPAGEFSMGSENGDSDEKPVHTVYLDEFWIDLTEVTNAMYALCVQAGACQPPIQNRSSTRNNYYLANQYAENPVINVNWYSASNYCEWAGRTLPSEAQWEKAARGANGRTYPWGEGLGCTRANYSGCYGDTTRVGRHPAGASPYGALDLAGNVWEWTADWYGETYYASSHARNPTGPETGIYHVLRGGSWDDHEWYMRSANRKWGIPAYWYVYVGFRCSG
jgi:formylglycine-generating enzyme required for sulfatase activity